MALVLFSACAEMNVYTKLLLIQRLTSDFQWKQMLLALGHRNQTGVRGFTVNKFIFGFRLCIGFVDRNRQIVKLQPPGQVNLKKGDDKLKQSPGNRMSQ